MHIPDGFLSIPVAVFCWIVSAVVLAVVLARVRRSIEERQVPRMGILAAFLFAAQMINFPVAGGTSGHLLGGVLAAILLGPEGAALVMTAVIAVQGLLFQDGGLLAMGANLLNMGLLSVAVGTGVYQPFRRASRRVRLAGAGLAAWLSVVAGALAVAIELWLSGTAALGIVAPAMLAIHALIGVGEAVITVAALAFLLRLRPDLVEREALSSGDRSWAVLGLAACLLVLVVSPLASFAPDGLERVAIDLGFALRAQDNPFQLLSDYRLPFLGGTPLSTILAGLIGAVLIAALGYLVTWLVGHGRKKS